MSATSSIRPPSGFSGKRGEAGKASGWYAADSAGKTWYFWFDTKGRLRRTDATTAEAAAFTPNTAGQILGQFVAVVALAALDTGGGIFSWQNPEDGSVVIERVVLDVTTKTTAACTGDFGTTATSATTVSDNLIDGLDLNAATGIFDNLGDAGTNGKTRQKLATGKWVTGSMKTGAAAGLVGYAYIFYTPLES